MCGIAGILHFDQSSPVDQTMIKAMANSIAHRGPDAEGFWFGGGVALAHRRLSIIDLSEGAQPMTDASGHVHVVFNGEIYNYKSLRETLLDRGHPLRTNSDTEVLLYLYRDHGADMVRHLRGMFAFAIWDSTKQQVLLARDRIGQKPLYYFADDRRLVFGSEIKAILACNGIDRGLDSRAIDAYLAYGFIPNDLSIFKSIRKLPPAHTLVISRERGNVESPKRYWEISPKSGAIKTADEWVEAVQTKFTETVECHCVADVPVGAFLSGGVDSSAVVAEMAANCREPLKTFSIGFEEEAYSELPYARVVAQQYGTDHIEEIVTPDVASDFQKLIHHYDEPFADSSALPTMAVARVASQHVKVAISGDGGDEAFGGYSRYRHDLLESQLRNRLPTWLRNHVLSPIAHAWPRADWLPRPLRLKSTLTNLALDAKMAYANTLSIACQRDRTSIFPHGGRNGWSVERFVTDTYPPCDDLKAMTLCDIAFVLPDDFLVKVDRASMAFGLEVRPPMVDHEFLELAASIPSEFKLRNGQSKWIFKQALARKLPKEILHRPKKGFEIPVDAWLRGPLAEQLADAIRTGGPCDGIFNVRVLKSVFESHRTGKSRAGNLLWAILVFGQWKQHNCAVN